METIIKAKRKLLGSAWPFVVIAILFAILTPSLLNLYGTGHWAVMQTAYILDGNAEILSNKFLPNIDSEKSKQTAEKTIKMIEHSSEKLKKAGHKIMRFGGLYHITSLLSVLFIVLAFISKKPWWGGLISLPFTIYAMSFFYYYVKVRIT